MSKQRISSPDMVKLIMMERVYKKHPMTIPISKIGGQFQTGQDLPEEKMTGKVPLTPEERAKYPFVINPTDFYKAPDGKIYNLKDSSDAAMVQIIKLSGMVAESETEYNLDPMRFVGYFYNSAKEATAKNQFDDLAYEAESLIRNTTADSYVRLVLAMNWKLDSKDFYIPPRGRTVDELKQHLIAAARKYPEKVKNCFPQFNPGIDTELFILELIHYKVLIERPNGDVFYKDQFIGTSVQDIVRYLSRGENDFMRSTWSLLLQEKKGSISSETVDKFLNKQGAKEASPVEKFSELTIKFQNAVYMESLTDAVKCYDELAATIRHIPAGLVTFDFDLAERKISQLRDVASKGSAQESETEVKETIVSAEALMQASLKSLQGKIVHGSNPLWNKEDCAEFWEDKEKLVEYMLTHPNK